MKTAIKTLEEKIKDNKIADFSKFYPTGNQEVAHFAEQYCEEKKIILYRALYNYMTEESGFITLSVHKTKQGARDAVARELRKEREKHNALYDYNVNEMAYRYGLFQAWLVDETEVQE